MPLFRKRTTGASQRQYSCLLLAALALVIVDPHTGSAQVVTGRTTNESSGQPLSLVEVVLLTGAEESVAVAISDSLGSYELPVPQPGEYYVQADMLGYRRLRTPLLDLSDARTVVADFELPPDPIELEGLQVEVEAMDELRRELRSYGLRLDDLGERFVSVADIAKRPTARDFGHVLQWQSVPGMRVIRLDELWPPRPEVCVQLGRGREGCALMVLDGARITLETAYGIPAHNLRSIVVLRPEEATLLYGTEANAGAVLLFTQARPHR